jgi:transposase-like protein
MISGEHICKHCGKTFAWEYHPAEPLWKRGVLETFDERNPDIAWCKKYYSGDKTVMLLGCYCPRCDTPNSFEHTLNKPET